MSDWIRSRILRFMCVPHNPTPPYGAEGSVRIFRAGKNFLNLRLCRWGLAQFVAFIGIIFWFGVFSDIEQKVEEQRVRAARPKPAASGPVTPAPAPASPPAPGNNAVERVVNKMVSEVQAQTAETEQNFKQDRKTKQRFGPLQGFHAWRNSMVYFLSHLPEPAMLVIWFFEVAGFMVYVLQLPVTLLIVRLEFEQHWYIVTDRSLRIRTGLVRLQESTMSFANLQQVEVQQGPLQRLLGLADVHVQSAGGGSGHQDAHQGREVDSLHTGIFHSVDNATEIRDLILERLRQFRQAGLGDPDDHHDHPPMASPAAASASATDTLAAAHELLAEARALRQALS